MLSKALEKANTAVLLDNATNYEGALDAYQDACRLLEFVMERTGGTEDKRKLDAIRDTYLTRIDELVQLQPPSASATVQKSLPPRPMSNESLVFSPSLDLDETVPDHGDSAVVETATLTRIVDAPAHNRDPSPRNSFLTDAIREVEGSSSGGFLGPLWEKSKLPLRESTLSDRTARAGHVEETYMPRPLSPHVPSPGPSEEPTETDRSAATSNPDSVIESAAFERVDPVSWLDTIDESGSDRSSINSYRQDPMTVVPESEPDFDAAFDAAIEAAYEEGYMPDHDAVDETGPQGPTQPTAYSIDLEVAPPPDAYAFPADEELDIDAEEERILDEITREYIDNGYDFDMQSKSALPRQSDSSVFSRDTWQSSAVSHRTTAGTSISTVAKGMIPDMRPEDLKSDLAQFASALEPPPGQVPTRPLSVISEGARSVQDRRSTGPNFKQLKIETARKPLEQWSRTPLAAVDDENARDDMGENAQDETGVSNRPISEVPSLHRFEKSIASPRIANPSTDRGKTTTAQSLNISAPTDSGDTISGARSPRPRLFRKNKSSLSLHDHSMLISEEPIDSLATTPLSASYAPSLAFHDSGLATSRRPYITPSAGSSLVARDGSTPSNFLFDTSLTTANQLTTPLSPESTSDLQLEPCPESSLLRPFWLLRCIASTINHPRGGYLTTRLFFPREAWQTRGVKLKSIDEKIANCDLLTAALGKLRRRYLRR